MKLIIPKIASLRSPSIGHLILNTMRYLDVNKNQKLIITTIKKNIINYEIYKILKNHYQNKNITFVHSRTLYFIYKILFRLSSKINFLKRFVANIEWYHHEVDYEKNYGALHRFYDKSSFNVKSKILVLKEQEKKFEAWRKKNFFQSKYVVFFSRDGQFYNDKNNPRNSNFEKYQRSIEYLIKSGFSVIRMGRSHEKNFNYVNKNFFDYSKICNEVYDDLIELMIFNRCEFMVGSVTGMLAYNTLFDKPLLINNWFPAGYYPWFRNSIFIPKLYRKNKKLINFNEIPRKVLLSEDEAILKKYSLEIIENSEDEIFNQVYNFIKQGMNSSIELNQKDYYVCGAGSKIEKSFYKKYRNLF